MESIIFDIEKLSVPSEPLTFLSIAVPIRPNNEQFLVDCVCCEAKTVNEESFVD